MADPWRAPVIGPTVCASPEGEEALLEWLLLLCSPVLPLLKRLTPAVPRCPNPSLDDHARSRKENDGIAPGMTVLVTVDQVAQAVPQT